MFGQSALIPLTRVGFYPHSDLPYERSPDLAKVREPEVKSPSPTLGEGFRVRAAFIGMLPKTVIIPRLDTR